MWILTVLMMNFWRSSTKTGNPFSAKRTYPWRFPTSLSESTFHRVTKRKMKISSIKVNCTTTTPSRLHWTPVSAPAITTNGVYTSKWDSCVGCLTRLMPLDGLRANLKIVMKERPKRRIRSTLLIVWKSWGGKLIYHIHRQGKFWVRPLIMSTRSEITSFNCLKKSFTAMAPTSTISNRSVPFPFLESKRMRSGINLSIYIIIAVIYKLNFWNLKWYK